jgi:glutamyl-tRNA(Gln) amidotransferase subunit E
MPTAARMYPETDTIPIVPDVKHIKLPELIEEKIKRYEKEFNISNDLASPIVKEGLEFESFVKRYKKVSPLFIANTIVNTPKEIKRRYFKEIDVEKYLDGLLTKIESKEITNEAVFEILVDIANGHKVDYIKYAQVNDKEVEEEIRKIISENKDKSKGAIMGMAMNKFRGKIDGKKVSIIVNKYFKE